MQNAIQTIENVQYNLVTKNCSRKYEEKANALCDASKRQIYSAIEKYVLSQFVKNNIYIYI